MKSENGTLPAIELYSANVQSKRDVGPVATLATNIDATAGFLYITVPDVANGTYRVTSEFISSFA